VPPVLADDGLRGAPGLVQASKTGAGPQLRVPLNKLEATHAAETPALWGYAPRRPMPSIRWAVTLRTIASRDHGEAAQRGPQLNQALTHRSGDGPIRPAPTRTHGEARARLWEAAWTAKEAGRLPSRPW
jgi:hypothetical protein